jgi:hypothetical protein
MTEDFFFITKNPLGFATPPIRGENLTFRVLLLARGAVRSLLSLLRTEGLINIFLSF